MHQSQDQADTIAGMPAKTKLREKRCFARCHIPPAHFSLYDFASAICAAAKSDAFYVSTRNAAQACCASRRGIMRSIRWLCENGWFETKQEPQAGRDGKGRYRVVGHEEWVGAHGIKTCWYDDDN